MQDGSLENGTDSHRGSGNLVHNVELGAWRKGKKFTQIVGQMVLEGCVSVLPTFLPGDECACGICHEAVYAKSLSSKEGFDCPMFVVSFTWRHSFHLGFVA